MQRCAKATNDCDQIPVGSGGDGEREHLLFWFLTTEANHVVRSIHAKAMPVMLPAVEEFYTRLSAESG